jgi:hypothetical protein
MPFVIEEKIKAAPEDAAFMILFLLGFDLNWLLTLRSREAV